MRKYRFLISLATISLIVSNTSSASEQCEKLLTIPMITFETATQKFHSYLAELFKNGILNIEELQILRDSIADGTNRNPIRDSELEIRRAIASDIITKFLENPFHAQEMLLAIDRILNTETTGTALQNKIDAEITGLQFQIETADEEELLRFITEYFTTPESVRHPNLLRLAIERTPPSMMEHYPKLVFSNSNWMNHPELLELAIQLTPSNFIHLFALHVFSQVFWVTQSESLLIAFLKTPEASRCLYYTQALKHPHWAAYPTILRTLIQIHNPQKNTWAVTSIFQTPEWASQPESLRFAIENSSTKQLKRYQDEVLIKSHWQNHLFYEIFSEAALIENRGARAKYLEERLGPYSWNRPSDWKGNE